ncbi:MAG: hypothetical protein KA397_02465 [Paludibacteraceae bacterium]|nr:hypothetical protein [Paludibacteraceae bacterium]MBP6284883.1 hypothetical protein [Paludibacteraceae bacterium]
MNYTERNAELNKLFSIDKASIIETPYAHISFFPFNSQSEFSSDIYRARNDEDKLIDENLHFSYPVFMPPCMLRAESAILLLHGLNERSWSKYLAWAEYLCHNTKRPVILFPLAFHINRAPKSWSNPKDLADMFHLRRQLSNNDRLVSVANVTLSTRITENPHRFYSSGRQSIADVCNLMEHITGGQHPFFRPNTTIDIFAYSIGGFLAEIALMANPRNLFAKTKLFLFCGGGIFSSMQGKSRGILDSNAFETLRSYFMHDFSSSIYRYNHDDIDRAFDAMIDAERNQLSRESFFSKLGNRIKGIALSNDMVIPYKGILQALGLDYASKQITQLDFPYPYTHENPFPSALDTYKQKVNDSFDAVFSQAALFFK